MTDLRYALRSLAGAPAYALGMIAVLALGIGVNVAIFGLVDAVLFRRLPVERPEELVRVFAATQGPARGRFGSSYPVYLEYRDQASAFSGLAAFSGGGQFNLSTGDAQAERVSGATVTGNYFQVLGVRALVGRTLLPEDDRAKGAGASVVISERLWRRRFGASPAAIGAPVTLNATPFTIVGVAPRGFIGATIEDVPDLWVPTSMVDAAAPSFRDVKPLERRGFSWLDVVGRLAPGVTLAQAQAQLDAIATRRAATQPADQKDPMPALVPAEAATLGETQGASARRLAWLLVGVVGFVLLIACADAAGLLMARAERRQREVAIRVALGASRARLVRQMLLESAILALAGAALGVLAAVWLTRLVVATAPDDFVLPLDVATGALAPRALAVAVAAALATTALFGVAPALRAAGADPLPSLKGERRTVGAGRARVPARGALVAAQVALSVILLVGAGLLARTLANAAGVRPGFDPDGVVVASVDFGRSGYTREQRRRFQREILARLQATPGVQHAALAHAVPVQGSAMANSLVIDGYVPKPDEALHASVIPVSDDYFAAMRIPLVRGRTFGGQDADSGAAQVAIINRAFAERFWPGQDPVGKWIGDVEARVVGVVGDVRLHSLREPPPLTVYRPLAQFGVPSATVVARTTLAPAVAMRAVAAAVAAVDRDLPLFNVRTLREKLGAALAQERVLAALLSAFALLALLLSAAGLYSLIAYTAQARTREWGIRIALGARAGHVLGLVQRQALVASAAGLAAGLAGAAALTRLARGLLFGVAPVDPATYAGAAVVLLAVGAAAAWVPARRAVRVNPVEALRSE